MPPMAGTTPDGTPEAAVEPLPYEPPRHMSPLLARRGAVAGAGPDAGVAWHYGDPTAEQRALARGGAVVDQSHLGVVRVAGPDRLTWLHSITTAQLADLAPRTSAELLVLSPHGHLEHHAAVVDDGAATWLITETPVALAAWLNRMRFTLRVEVEDVTDAWAAIGEPVGAEGGPDEPVTWRDPWPAVVEGGTRYGPPAAEHPGADRAWRLVLVPRGDLAAAVAARGRRAGRWPARGPRRRCASRRGGRAPRARRTTAPSRTSWTGCAPRCTCTRAATAARRRSRACTTWAVRRVGWCSCTSTARGTSCPSRVRSCTSRPTCRVSPDGRWAG